ncbi:MAG: TonB-dependent receptor [Bacteroidales bacterium]|nr:TonB-dependent receptor [Bacteroidales bacterium]
MKKILFFVLLFGLSIAATAQITVQGTVKSAVDGISLPGVSVLLKGTTTGTVTDLNGHYSITVPKTGILVFSYVGFKSQEIIVGEQKVINVSLSSKSIGLNELVVVGYGSEKRQNVTGSVSVIPSDVLKNRPSTEFGNSLEGTTAGVQIIRPSGQPQAGFSIRIRGISSITSGSDPLYIVDGVKTYNVNEINPDDIASITVLKDAASAAIYGSEAANGVVLITTKHGGDHKTIVSFSSSLMLSQPWKKLQVLNSTQFEALATELGLSLDWNQYTANTNWQNLVFRNAMTQNYQFSVAGGDEKTDFYISSSVLKQEGIVLNNGLNRTTFNANIDHRVSKFFKVGTNLSYDKWNDVSVPENSRNGIINSMLTYVPIIGVWDSKNPDQYAVNPFIPDLENPVATVYQPQVLYTHNRFRGNAYVELNFLSNLKFKSLLGYEHSNSIYTSFQNPTQTSYGRSMDGLAAETDGEYTYWNSQNTLNYNQSFGDNHFTLLAGFVASRESGRSLSVSSTGFGGSTAIQTVTPGTVQSVPQVSIYQKSNASFISRLTYAYKDKYLFTSNFRADGSGQFPEANRWGYFPSFSVGWRISNENFFKNIKKVINSLKLRAGYGIVGNDRANPYAWYGLVNPGVYVLGGTIVNTYTPASLENSSLRWEQTDQLDIGLDIALFEDKIQITTDYYNKKTTNLLLYVPIPESVGIPGNVALQNAGSMVNKGFEFQINSKNISNENFTWNTSFNISFNRGKVLSIVGTTIHSGDINPEGTTYNLSIVKAGLPLGSFYGYISEGVDPQTGMIKYKDLNHDGVIDANDETVIGNANPKFTYGLTNTFTYKDFTLNLFIQGVQGNNIFDATKMLTESMRLAKNQSADVLKRWEKPGDITSIPRAILNDVSNSQPSTRYIENGSYLRVKSFTLGYNLPKRLLSHIKLSHLMVYITSDNLLTFTKYSGFDPDVSAFNASSQGYTNQNTAPGVDYGTYPQSRDFLFGFKASF